MMIGYGQDADRDDLEKLREEKAYGQEGIGGSQRACIRQRIRAGPACEKPNLQSTLQNPGTE